MIQKYASPLITFVIIISITSYVLAMNFLIPASDLFVK